MSKNKQFLVSFLKLRGERKCYRRFEKQSVQSTSWPSILLTTGVKHSGEILHKQPGVLESWGEVCMTSDLPYWGRTILCSRYYDLGFRQPLRSNS